MPFINGRFYANPVYGRALEIARIGEQLGQNDLLGGTDATQKQATMLLREYLLLI